MPRRALDRWQVLRAHVENDVPLVALARHHGVPLRTLQRWHAAYQRDGRDGLTDSPRRDRGTHRLPPQLQALIEGLALVKPRASVAAITRRAQATADDHGWPPPSYAVVRRLVDGLDPAMVTLAHDGPVSYRDRYELVWRPAADHPNDQWQADHTELDILIVDAAGAPARPWSPGRRPAPPHPDVDIGRVLRPHRELHRRALTTSGCTPNWGGPTARVDP